MLWLGVKWTRLLKSILPPTRDNSSSAWRPSSSSACMTRWRMEFVVRLEQVTVNVSVVALNASMNRSKSYLMHAWWGGQVHRNMQPFEAEFLHIVSTNYIIGTLFRPRQASHSQCETTHLYSKAKGCDNQSKRGTKSLNTWDTDTSSDTTSPV